MKGMFFIFLCFLASGIAMADQDEIRFGLVKEGSFLLSRAPNTLRDGIWVHSLVGYLPTGTRVVIGDKKTVTNLKTSDDETYYFVKSELGTHGLLREDLLIQSNGKVLAVSIASYDIQIHQPYATLENPKKRFSLGRHGGNYLEITGESAEGFFDVVLHRENHEGTGLPATEKARLKKFYVAKNQVAILDPNDESLRNEFNMAWSTIGMEDNSIIEELVNNLTERTGGSFDKIKSIISDVNDLQCLMGTSVDADLGFKVFSSGFALGLDAALKEKGVKYIFETQELSNGTSSKYYSGIGIVKCDGPKPVRLQNFTLQEGLTPSKKRFSVRLSDLIKSKSKWITTLQGSTISNKMVRISGWNEYNQLMKELNDYAKSGDGYLSRLPEKKRLLLLNYIVSRIGYFEHRGLRL